MRALRVLPPRTTDVLAFGALVLACTFVVQDSGPNQAAHHALVRALASGTAEIDPRETIDAAYVNGEYFAAKAPGLAMFTLPWHLSLRGVGLQDAPLSTEDGYRQRLWELNLFGAVLPMLLLLLLVFVVVERVVPGYGLPTAVLLGAGTLLLPFATLFFDHVLSAAIGFAAFVVLFLERERRRASFLAAAGVLAGLAIVVEFPLGIVALVLVGYAAAGERPIRRVLVYAGGVLAGVVPLLVYNTWALGSPLTLSYTNALKEQVGTGAPVVGANDPGFYGIGLPEPRVALSILFSEKGLLVVTPIVLVALVGLPLLWRVGRRAEAVVSGTVPLLFLAYNASYYLPFGGQSPGPRFMVPAVPFLALPLALALKRRPMLVGGIALVSTGVMALATITDPLIGTEYGIATWLDDLRASSLVDSVFGAGWLAELPFVLLLVFALGLAFRALPLTWDRVDAVLLVGGLASWLLVASTAPDLLPADAEHGTTAGVLAVVFVALAIGVVLGLVASRGAVALLLLVPAFLLASPQLEARPRWSLLVATIWLAVVAVAWWLSRRAPADRAKPGPILADDATVVTERVAAAD